MESDNETSSEQARHLAQHLISSDIQEQQLAKQHLERLLPNQQAQVMFEASALASEMKDFPQARSLLEASLSIRRQQKNLAGVAEVLGELSVVAYQLDAYALARACFEEVMLLPSELLPPDYYSAAHFWLGTIAQEEGDYGRARSHYEISQTLMEPSAVRGDLDGKQIVVACLGSLAYEEEDYIFAHQLFEQSLALARIEGASYKIPPTLLDFALVECRMHNLVAAHNYVQEAISVAGKHRQTTALLNALIVRARIAICEGHWEQAAQLLGAEAALRAAEREKRVQHWRAEFDRCEVATRSSMGNAAFMTAQLVGSKMTIEQAFS
jgi:tetratricopeptide (TPR) repeat protein